MAPSPPRPPEVLAWVGRLNAELVRIPTTLFRARNLLVDLPVAISRLADGLEATTGSLDGNLPPLNTRVEAMTGNTERLEAAVVELSRQMVRTTESVDAVVTELRGFVELMDARLAHMDEAVSQLGGTVNRALGAIPGMRRAVRG